ncbi:MAG: helix-turn-helix domain-containing protein [Acidobacteriota bacterium]|nr:helix-turn-helix domain-containing protein [Acidobacteriota bacterium]
MQHIMADDVGGRLRRAREQRGLSLRDAAHRTKLSIFTLEAIERNDFGRLPGGMFRKAYVRTLAAEVGLDPGELASEYCARFEPREEPAPPERPGRRVDRARSIRT